MTEGQVSEENNSTVEENQPAGDTPQQEETPAKETPPKAGTNDSINMSLDEIDDLDVLKGMVRSLRAENANHRRSKKTLTDEVEGLKAWKVQNVKSVGEAEEKAARADQVAKRYVIKAAAMEYDVDDDLVELINGDTEDEIWAKAEKLANTKKDKGNTARNPLDPGWVPGPTQLMPGKRGNPLTGKPTGEEDDGSWLKRAWDRS